MENFSNKINRIEQEGINISSDSLLKEAFKYYKKIVVISGLAFLLLIVITFVFTIFFVSNHIENPQELGEKLKEFNPIYLPLKGLLIYILLMSIISAIGSILNAGFIQIVADASKNKLLQLKTIFRFFIRKDGLYILFAHFIITFLFTSISLLLQMGELSYVALAINWIVNATTALVTPLIIFDNLNPFQAIKYSIQIVNKQPITIIFTLLLTSFLVGIGALFFIVGLFFTIPFIYCIYFALYNQTVGYSEEE